MLSEITARRTVLARRCGVQRPAIADGSHWLTRFLRKQAEAPPTVADRAAYLRAELAKPEGERVLLMPEIDAQQRPYRQ
jgi:hypothetical protein